MLLVLRQVFVEGDNKRMQASAINDVGLVIPVLDLFVGTNLRRDL